jgi:hypothetical protein
LLSTDNYVEKSLPNFYGQSGPNEPAANIIPQFTDRCQAGDSDGTLWRPNVAIVVKPNIIVPTAVNH